MTKLRWLLPPVAVVLLALVVACGGKSNKTASVDSDASGGGTTTSRELDLTNAANSLLNVKSFRFDIGMKMDVDTPDGSNSDEDALGAAFLALLGNINMQGAYVSPDSFELQTRLFGQEMHVIQIGGQAWINEGSGWEETDAAGDLSMFGGSPQDMFSGLLPQQVLSAGKTSSETVNGQKTTHYSFDKDALADVAETLGEDVGDLSEVDQLNLDVWVNQDNLPVKMTLKASGESEGTKMDIEITANVTDLNDSSIKIQKPI